MHTAVFSISLNSEQVLLYYKGKKHRVQVRTREGFTMKPALRHSASACHP